MINGFVQKTPKSEIETAKKYRKDYIEGVRRMRKLDEFLVEQLQDEEFKKEYENLQSEFDIIRAMVDARTSQNLIQKQ